MSKPIMLTLLLFSLGNSYVQEVGKSGTTQEVQAGVKSRCLLLKEINPKQLKVASGFVDTPETDPYLDTSKNPKDPYRMRLLNRLYTDYSGGPAVHKLRDGVIKYHTCFTVSGHYLSGADVYYLPKEKVFFLDGQCTMNHLDGVVGPFVGDPRIILPRVAVPNK